MARAGGSGARGELRAKATGPSAPQTANTVGYVAAVGPLLVVPSMACGDNIDGTALWYLVSQVIERRKVLEEEERRKQEEKEKEEEQNEAKLRAHLSAIHSSSWYQEKKGKAEEEKKEEEEEAAS